MAAEFFLDTSFVIASISPRDQYHLRAQAIDREIRSLKQRVVTTTAVLLEIGKSLAKRRTRVSASQAIELLLADPSVDLVQLDEPLFHRAR